MFCFFKQKTAYEMRISDWSSDVCSSVLLLPDDPAQRAQAIRGLVYIVANCYTPIGIIDFPERWLVDADEATRQQLVSGTRQRLYRNWALFADQFAARPFLSGAEPGALDILAAVVTKWEDTREAMLNARPPIYELRSEEHTTEIQTLMRI